MAECPDILVCNRAMLIHFDGYSAALSFAKWGPRLLAPAGLPPDAAPMAPPAAIGPQHQAPAVAQAVADRLGLDAAAWRLVAGFDPWFSTAAGPLRVHLLRSDAFEPPKAAIEAQGGVFHPISALRGSPRDELGLAREVFNLIVGAGGGRA